MANLAGRNPFLALDDMDIGIAPGFTLTDQEKALAATSIIHAAYEELGPSPSNLDSGIATALANRSIAGAHVTVGSSWVAAVQVGGNTQSSINLTANPILEDFPIFYVAPGCWAPRLITAYANYQATIYYTLTSPAGVGLTIVWGDGNTQTVTTGTEVTHTYATAGTYDMQIRGAARSLGFSGFSDVLKAILAPLQGITGITSMTSFCFNCSGLTSLPTDLFRYLPEGITTFGNVLYGCSGLTSLPTDLFRYSTAATNFGAALSGCTALGSIPADLFRYNTLVTDFGSVFDSCTNLALRSDIFGTDYANRFLNKSVVFTGSFSRSSFTGTQGVAPELWSFDFGTGAPVKTQCFKGVGNSLTSLSNYASIPSGWIS